MIRSTSPRWARWAVAVAAGTGLVACAGDQSTTGSTDEHGGDHAPQGPVVDIVDAGSSWEFEPQSLEVPAGSRVTWTNSSNAPHNVVFDDKSLPQSDNFDPQKRYTATLTKKGTFPYLCTLHPAMKAEITVT